MDSKFIVNTLVEGLEGYLMRLSKAIRDNEASLTAKDKEALIEALLLAKNDFDYIMKLYLID
jgi:hypothetical protein